MAGDDDVLGDWMQHHGEKRMGFPGNRGVAFPVRGGGWGPGSGLFPWAGCSSRGEVGVPDKRCEARFKKKEWG
jgi:hypothetical protein